MKIVVAGGGFGGVKTALELANKAGMEVTLLSPRAEFEYHSSLLRSAAGASPSEVIIRLEDIFKQAPNVKVAVDSVANIDSNRKIAIGTKGTMYDYDALVLALGNRVSFMGVEGMSENAATARTVMGTIDLRGRLVHLCRNENETPHVVIIGAGQTGIELAGEIQMFSQMVAKKNGIKEKKFHVTIVDKAPRVLPGMSEKASKIAFKRLLKLGIDVKINVKVVRCDATRVLLETGEIPSDLTVWAAGSHPPDFYKQFPELFTYINDKIEVDQQLHAKGSQSIYVIGDNAYTRYSGMAQTALHDAKFVATNFLFQQAGVPVPTYKGVYPLYYVPIGPHWALLQTQKALLTGYPAWLAKSRADKRLFRAFEPYDRAIWQWRKGNFETQL